MKESIKFVVTYIDKMSKDFLKEVGELQQMVSRRPKSETKSACDLIIRDIQKKILTQVIYEGKECHVYMEDNMKQHKQEILKYFLEFRPRILQRQMCWEDCRNTCTCPPEDDAFVFLIP
jgi:hypothetical protein